MALLGECVATDAFCASAPVSDQCPRTYIAAITSCLDMTCPESEVWLVAELVYQKFISVRN